MTDVPTATARGLAGRPRLISALVAAGVPMLATADLITVQLLVPDSGPQEAVFSAPLAVLLLVGVLLTVHPRTRPSGRAFLVGLGLGAVLTVVLFVIVLAMTLAAIGS